MKTWKIAWLAALIAALSSLFLLIMRPPGANPSAAGYDQPWQISRSPDGTTITVLGLTLNHSTVRDAVQQLGQRYELGLFADQAGRLSLEVYFRDAVIGGLNARLAMSTALPEATLNAMKAQVSPGKPTADGGRRYPIPEQDHNLAMGAILTGITLIPVAKFDAELIQKRFGPATEQITVPDGTHWLYPAIGLDILLGTNGAAILQYAPPPEFASRLRVPLVNNVQQP